MILYNIDELKIYSGHDYAISDHIKLRQPKLAEIRDYGEQEFDSMLYYLTATPQTFKVFLWDNNIDYTEITPYELFVEMIYQMFPVEKTSIIFGDLDFQKFKPMQRNDNDEVVLYQAVQITEKVPIYYSGKNIFKKTYYKLFKRNKIITYEKEILLDEFTYEMMSTYLRKIYNIQADIQMPGNQHTKEILIEDAKMEIERNKNKEYKSQLKNLISTMINNPGFKYNHETVWDLKVDVFMDSVKRILKTDNAKLLLQSGYSGYGVNLKDIDEKQLDYYGELD